MKLATAVRERVEGTEPATVLKISVRPQRDKGEKVNVAVPLGIVEMVAACIKAGPLSEENFEAWGMGPGKTGVHFAALVKELPEIIATIRGIGPVEILSVKGDHEDVRVWTE